MVLTKTFEVYMPIYLKSCLRCNGDVAELRDIYGTYLDCVQCGSQPMTLPNERRKRGSISIDDHVEALWLLQKSVVISEATLSANPNAMPLQKQLENMTRYGYVDYERKGKKEGMYYTINKKGKSVVNAYRTLIKTVLNSWRSNGNKRNAISSYELVGEDGKLTLIGEYFVKASPVIAEFVEDIYPMTTLSIEHQETPDKTQKSRAVLNLHFPKDQ